MKFNIKDLLILIIPIVLFLAITPILPAKVPYHWSIDGTVSYMDKKYFFITGVLPYLIYKSRQLKRK